MTGVKLFDLARELGMSNNDLMSTLKDLGIQADRHTSVLDDATASLVREMLSQDKSVAKQGRTIEIGQSISVRDLADAMGVSTGDVQKRLLEMGTLASLNQQIGADVAEKIAEKFAYQVKIVQKKDQKDVKAQKLAPQAKSKHPSKLVPRPPVVTIMGHVDHGKTTLLDTIRKTHVTAQEFGGITQHIGAYQVEVQNKKITFLDTPGHEAFTAMRARGASVTDIAILVVAADDSVMPQTIEAIDHARAAEVPIIVAINKVDKADANVDKTKQQLAERGLVSEDWGGDTIMVPLSAKQGQGIDQLLEMILLVAEMAELKADASASNVAGHVVEAKVEPGRGPVATVLIERGTLKIGSPVVAGEAYGKVKAMFDDKGNRVTKAGPATPVEVLGLSQAPLAGDVLEGVKDDRQARQIAEKRIQESRQERMAAETKITLEDLYKQIKEGEVKELNIILKADVQGTEEAVRQSLEKIEHEEVRVKVIHSGVGDVSESDILLASASNAIAIGFNVKVDPRAIDMADAEHVEVRTYNIIYELINDVKSAMSGLLEPVIEEVHLGVAEVRALFRVPRVGIVAGCYVTEGKIVRGTNMRVTRKNEVVFDGKLDNLKHLKEDVREMAAGFECGISSDSFTDYQVEDLIECYTTKAVARAV